MSLRFGTFLQRLRRSNFLRAKETVLGANSTLLLRSFGVIGPSCVKRSRMTIALLGSSKDMFHAVSLMAMPSGRPVAQTEYKKLGQRMLLPAESRYSVLRWAKMDYRASIHTLIERDHKSVNERPRGVNAGQRRLQTVVGIYAEHKF